MLKLNQTYTLTPKIQELENKLSAHKTALSLIPVKPEIITNLRRHSLLHSALYSAKIEGISENTDLDKLAIQNLHHAYTEIYNLPAGPLLSIDLIKSLHGQVQNNLRTDAGHFRTEQSAIFNSGGVAIYLTPPPYDIIPLIEKWLDKPPDLASILISHYQFEKIHPFIDGNGRVGRLLLSHQLRQIDLDFSGLLSLEQSIDKSRDTYYYHLQTEKNDLTGWVEYLLELMVNKANQILVDVTKPNLATPKSHLLPRRQELLNIIHDHSPCSFDFLHRRFIAIPNSTLRYDLLQLQKAGLIQKLGTTRGALYSFPE